MSALGTFLLGRLVVHANGLQSMALKALLNIAVALIGILVVVAPGVVVALPHLGIFPSLPTTLHPGLVNSPLVLVCCFLYWIVIYSSFLTGLGGEQRNG